MFQVNSYIKNKFKRITSKKTENTGGSKSQLDLRAQHPMPAHKADIRSDTLLATLPGNSIEHFFSPSYELQLRLLRKALNLNTAAFLVSSPSEGLYYLQTIDTVRDDIDTTPFKMGSGITGAIAKESSEIALSQVNASFHGLPCYRKRGNIGSLFAVRCSGLQDIILYVDRIEEGRWSEEETHILRSMAHKLRSEVMLEQQLKSLDQEKNVIQKVCTGLRELNRGLGLESVFQATAKAVNAFVDADFMSVSLLSEGTHYTAFIADSGQNEHLLGMEYDVSEGIVGQVLRLNNPLPANARYKGPAPVFSRYHTLSGYNSLLILPLKLEDGQPLGALTVAAKQSGIFEKDQQDILELIAGQVAIKIDLAKSHETISKMATTDGLTDLANHRTFQHAFDVMLHRATRRNSPLTLILCDIDFFKSINDNYGHPFGDEVLKQVAKTISDTVRKVDLAARYGGEEFAIILENSNTKGAVKMAERIRQDIAALSFQYEENKIGVTISLGIASYPDDGTAKTEIIDRADKALYNAKRAGRNQTVLWEKTFV